MKVEVKNRIVKSDIKYPCLMLSTVSNRIVLFNKCNSGTCICDGDINNVIGEYSNKWDMNSFVPFNGEVTLKND